MIGWLRSIDGSTIEIQIRIDESMVKTKLGGGERKPYGPIRNER